MRMKRKIEEYSSVLNPDKFWSWVKRGGEDECWEWTGGKNTSGYGLYSLNSPDWMYERTGRQKTQLLAHRVAWYIMHGEIGVGEHIGHSCGNKLCCNAAHMYKGCKWDNVWQKNGNRT